MNIDTQLYPRWLCKTHRRTTQGYLKLLVWKGKHIFPKKDLLIQIKLNAIGDIQIYYNLIFQINLQILFICGLAFVIGLERTFRFFFQQHKMKATAAFMGGILVVLLGWPLIGMIIETYGFILLFGWASKSSIQPLIFFSSNSCNQEFKASLSDIARNEQKTSKFYRFKIFLFQLYHCVFIVSNLFLQWLFACCC